MIFARTDRLTLRSYEERDIQAMFRLLNNWNIVKWMGTVPSPYTKLDARNWLEKMTAREQAAQPEFLVVADQKKDELIGAIGFHPLHNVKGEEGDFEVSYWLGEPSWGQGLMGEALPEALAWALRQSWIKRLAATTYEDNEPSIKLLKKLGFVYHGLRPCLTGCGHSEITFWLYPRAES